MKTMKYQMAIVALSFTLVSCAQSWNNKGVKGNGNVTTTTINTSDYDEIKVVGSMDVKLVEGDEGRITLTTDENLHEYVKVVSDNNVLTISIKNNVGGLSTRKGINLVVPFTEISSVTLTGSGDVFSNDIITSNTFDIAVTGSGDMDIEVDAQRIDAKLTGSGDVILKGSTKTFEVKISGSGDFNATGLRSDDTEAYVSGSGEADVYASKSLKARVNGSGDITYTGNPEKVDTKIMGSGDIESRN